MKSFATWGAVCAIGLSAMAGQAQADIYVVTHTGVVSAHDDRNDSFRYPWNGENLIGEAYTVVYRYTFDPSALQNMSQPEGNAQFLLTNTADAIVTIAGVSFAIDQVNYFTEVGLVSRAIINPGFDLGFAAQSSDQLILKDGVGSLGFNVYSAMNFVGSVDVRSPITYTLTDADRANPNTYGSFQYYGDTIWFRQETLSTAYFAGVPEPASWALMIVGFGGAGVTLRSRRRGARAA